MHILMIADNKDDYLLFARQIAKVDDFSLEWRDTPDDGLAYLNSQQVDALVLDLHLPRNGGASLFEQVQNHFPLLPVVIVSGNTASDEGLEAVRHGAQDFLSKADMSPYSIGKALYYAVERKRGESRLRTAEERYRLIIENQTDMISCFRRDFTLSYVNSIYSNLFNKTPEAMIGANVFDPIPPEDRDKAMQHFLSLNASKPVGTSENRLMLPDGSFRWVQWKDRIILDNEGQIIEYQGIGRDITEQKQVEAEKLEQQRLNDAMRESLLVLTTSLNSSEVLQYLLQFAGNVVPYDAGSIILFEGDQGRVAYVRGFPPAAEAFFKGYRFSLATSKYWKLRQNKEPYLIQDTKLLDDWVSLPITDWIRSTIGIPIEMRGHIIGLLAVDSSEPNHFQPKDVENLQAFAYYAGLALENADQITQLEQRVAERTTDLNQAKERVEAILNNSPDGIILAKTDLRIDQANDAFYRLFDCPIDAYFGQSLMNLFDPDGVERIRSIVEAAVGAKTSCQLEARVRRQDGTLFDAGISIGYIKAVSNRRDGLVCTIRDITEQKQAEQALKAKMDEERQLQEYMKALHEITIELTQIDQVDTFYKRAVELGLKRLGFERLAVFLYDEPHRAAIGTFGTDKDGNITDERGVHFEPAAKGIMARALSHTEHFCLDEDIDLFTQQIPAGKGWNAAAVLWNGSRSLGWLVADNAIHHHPVSKPLLDILALYGVTLGTLVARKQADQALQTSEEKFRRLMEDAPQAVVIVDKSGHIVLVNHKAEEVFCYQREELIGQPVEVLVPDDQRQSHTELRTGFTGLPHTRPMQDSPEVLVRRKNGSHFPAEIALSYIRMGDDMLIMSFIADITERKRTADALQKSSAEYLDLYNNAPCGYHSLDKTGLITQMNDTELNWLGYTREEVVGKLNIADLMTPDSQKAYEASIPVLIQLGWVNDLEFDFVRKDKSVISVLLNATGVYDEAGQFVISRSTVFDITERKQAEKELAEERNLLRTLIDSTPDFIYIKDIDHRFVLSNVSHALARRNSTPEELIGKSDFDYFPEELAAQFEAEEDDIFASGKPLLNHEGPSMGQGGIMLWAISNKVPLRNLDNQIIGLVGVTHDITERKQSEQVLRQALEREMELNELKSRFVSMASHEFRTPLATIMATSETLLAYREKLNAGQITQKLNRIQEQVQHLKGIMDDVLQLTRLEGDYIAFTPEIVDLDALCRDIVDEFQNHPDTKHRIIYTSQPQPFPLMLDKKLMRQIISNLVSNALKYSPGKEEVYIDLAYTIDQVVLKIRDEGIGIPPADLKHLFEPFHRAANVGTISGTGLGMPIAKSAIELHGGTITANSTVNVGTTFEVCIPFEKRPRSSPANESS